MNYIQGSTRTFVVRIGVIFICVLAVSMVGIAVYYHAQNTPITPVTPDTAEVVITDKPNDFTLKANSVDTLGVDPDTTFTLSSEQPIDKGTVKGAFVASPSFGYKIESTDSNTFTIVPESSLKTNTVYQFAISTATPETEDAHQFAWAYQTKNPFKVLSTIPANLATGVSLDLGIEIVLSNEKFKDPEQHITITPEVSGHFTNYRQTLVFLPDALQPATMYTVTIDKDFGVEGSHEKLGSEYQFQFETTSNDAELPRLGFEDQFYEYTAQDKPFFAFRSNDKSNLHVDAFKFDSFDDFSNAVDKQFTGIPYWARYMRQTHPFDTSGLQNVASFAPTLIDSDNFYSYFEFPTALDDGYYIVNLTNGNTPAQAFLQVTNLAASMQVSVDNTLIWAHDISTKTPAEGVSIHFSADDSLSQTTDSQGLANFTTPAVLQDQTSGSYNIRKSLEFFTLEKNGVKLLVPTKNSSNTFWYLGGDSAANRYYWGYLYTNRTLYLPTDAVHIWGFAQKRIGAIGDDVSTLTAKLQRSTWEQGDYTYTTYDEIDMTVSDLNTFEGSLQFPNVAPGGYVVRVFDGDQLVAQSSVEVATYTKPSYKIEVTPTTRAYFIGDTINFNIKTTFFDGTPVPNMQLSYAGSFGEGDITTNENGEAILVRHTEYPDDAYSSGARYNRFYIHNKNAEQTEISANATLYGFGPRYTLSADSSTGGTYSVNVNQISLDAMNSSDPNDFQWDYTGDPISNAPVNVTISHEYYDKTPSGTYYDYINKKIVTTYHYTPRSDVVATATLTTDANGTASSSFTPDSDKNYKIAFSVTDPLGKKATTNTWVSGTLGANYHSYVNGDTYSFVSQNELLNKSENYAPGSTIPLTVFKNSTALSPDDNDSFLYSTDYNGLRDVSASSSATHNFVLKPEYEPDFYAQGVFFDGRYYHLIIPEYNGLDTSSRKLSIGVTQDKEAYSPGDKVKLDIAVTDVNGNPVKNAEVNVSNIDEALAAIEWSSGVNTLSKLYAAIRPSVMFADVTHEEPVTNTAEGGGCFGPETPITMSDGSLKAIKDVVVGDELLTRASGQPDADLVKTTVQEAFVHLVNQVLIMNGTFRVTPEHIIWLDDAWQTAGSAKVGDWLRNAQGEKVYISSIEDLHGPQKVYNLHTAMYHTFLANGMYVHNEKAGGGVRDDLQDIAYFGSARTNVQGVARVSFDLPDNITSWLTTVQAVTTDRKANGIQTSIIATKPFFVDISNANTYLTDDQPVIRIRGFGVGVNANTDIQFEISYPGTNNETITRSAKAYVPVDVVLPDFTEGSYKIQVKGTAGNMTDTLVKSFDILPTYHIEQKADYNVLTDGETLSGSDSGLTTVTFTNNETGRYYWATRMLQYTYGDRIDQKLARKTSAQLLSTYFDEQALDENVHISDFQQADGGFGVLPYASSETLFTAKLMDVLLVNEYDKSRAIDYMYAKYHSENSTTDEVVTALMGLAEVGEPVLTDVNIMLANPDITGKQRLYLIRAAAELGAKEYAHGLLVEFLQQYAQSEDPYIKVIVGDDREETTEVTYQAAIVARMVDADEAFLFFDYATRNHTQYQLHVLDDISYLEHALSHSQFDPVAFDYTLNGTTEHVQLEKNERKVLALSPDDRNSISFSNITGSVATVSRYGVPLDVATAQQDTSLHVTRLYTVDGHETTIFHEGDLVKVNLSYSIPSDAIEQSYMFVDYLPSGMKPIVSVWNRGIYDRSIRYSYEINGQEIKFWAYRDFSSSFSYYAIVTSTGTYKGDAPVLQGYKVTDKRAFGSPVMISIE